MSEYEAGDRVRLVQILDPERTIAKWQGYVGLKAEVIGPALSGAPGLRMTRILFPDGEWFPAHNDEIEKVDE